MKAVARDVRAWEIDGMDAFPSRQPARPSSRKEARAAQRWRLLEAMAHLVGRRGYQATSIAQVIERAGVSRKSFYEYFDDKDACFLAAYQELSDRFLNALEEAGASVSASKRVGVQLTMYLEVLSRDVAQARAFIVEVLSAGPRALELREAVNRRFADLVFTHVKSPVVRKAVTGGVNDVVAGALLNGAKDLRPLDAELQSFVARVK